MTESLHIDRCVVCATELFPPRLACPKCGSSQFESCEAGAGVVVHDTTIHRTPGTGTLSESERPILGLVVLDSGPTVIARCSDGVRAGERVKLVQGGDGAVIAEVVKG